MSAPDLEPVTPHGDHARPPARGDRWAAFKASVSARRRAPVFIIAAAAGLFAGSYTYAMANPTPRNIPAAVVGDLDTVRDKVVRRPAGGARSTPRWCSVSTAPRPKPAPHWSEQKVFGILRSENGGVGLDVAERVRSLGRPTARRVHAEGGGSGPCAGEGQGREAAAAGRPARPRPLLHLARRGDHRLRRCHPAERARHRRWPPWTGSDSPSPTPCSAGSRSPPWWTGCSAPSSCRSSSRG